MAIIRLYIDSKDNIDNMEYKLGSAYFDLTNQMIYFDENGERNIYGINVDSNPDSTTEVLYGIKINGEVFKLFPISTNDVIDDDKTLTQILNAKADLGGEYEKLYAEKSLAVYIKSSLADSQRVVLPPYPTDDGVYLLHFNIINNVITSSWERS